MRVTAIDLLMPIAIAMAFLLLSWGVTRSINIGRKANPIQAGMMWYVFFFVLGMGYLMLVATALRWTDPLMFILMGIWGIILAFVAWYRNRRRRLRNA